MTARGMRKRKKLTDLAGLDRCPLEALDVDGDRGECGEEDDGLDTSLLALVVLRLGCPVQERDDVLRELRGRRRGAVLVLDEAVEDDTGHGDGATGEVRVVVHALTDLDTSGRVDVAGQERVDVILELGLDYFEEERSQLYIQQHHDEP